ncbi:hypothetical protein ACFPJ4_14015 [Lysinimonas soli]|uniref:DUF7847 domain-containing protein n=1 Tax=Lysinimonas soli TaxID=1074233 RepID=A0ABW0NUY4_9MICO
MTDDQHWQAPGAAPLGLPPVAASAAPPPPLHSVPLPGAAPGAGMGLAWTPPPKPGLIPLRPLTLGATLGGAFQVLRRNPAATLGPALLLTAAVAVIQAVGLAGFVSQTLALSSVDTGGGGASAAASDFSSGFLGYGLTSFVSALLSLVVTAIVQGIVTLQVASSTLGSRLRLGGLWRRLRGRRGALIGWAAIVGGVYLVSIGLVVLLLVGIGLTGSAGVGIAILLGVLLFGGIAVAFCWLWTKLGFVPTAIVLERTSILASVRRSWRLTRGAFWRVFGIRLLVAAMIAVATQIVSYPVSMLVSLAGEILQPNGTTVSSSTVPLIASLVATQGVTAVVGAVGLVLSTATTALLYLDRRMRLEGLDLDLSRFVERRQAGEPDLRDPYLPPAPRAEAQFGVA